MKKLAILLVLLFLPIIVGCKTTKQSKKIALPPKPERQELKDPETLKDYAEALNYYEHLVQLWENWGETTEALYYLEK